MKITTVGIDLGKNVFMLVVQQIRKGLTDERTALINQLRGLLLEFGIVIPKGRYQARHQLLVELDDAGNGIPSVIANPAVRIRGKEEKSTIKNSTQHPLISGGVYVAELSGAALLAASA